MDLAHDGARLFDEAEEQLRAERLEGQVQRIGEEPDEAVVAARAAAEDPLNVADLDQSEQRPPVEHAGSEQIRIGQPIGEAEGLAQLGPPRALSRRHVDEEIEKAR